jgi:PST family polysaccharide transporter
VKLVLMTASPPTESPGPSTQTRIRREGLIWLLANLTIVRVGGTIITLILRRLLGPGISGLFDLALTPYRFFDSVRNFGVGPVLVYERDLDRASADTGWTFNMLLAFALLVVANLLAYPIAQYYHHAGIERLIRLLSIAYVVSAAGSVHGFLLLRRLDLRSRSIPGVGQILIAGSAAGVAATWSTGEGPLVLRELLSTAVGTVLLWLVCPYRPRIRLAADLLNRQLRYSFWIGAGLMSLYVAQNADVFIAGHVIRKAADVGFYTTSWRITFIVAGIVGITVSTVVFPALSRAHDPVIFGNLLLSALRQTAFVVIPASLILAVVAPVLIVPVLGERWAPYSSDFGVLSVLALYGGARALVSVFFEGYKAIGKPWLLSGYNLVKAAVIVPAMIVAAPHGIRAVAAVYVPLMFVEVPASLVLARYVLGVRISEVWGAIQTPAFASACTVLLIVAVEQWLRGVFHVAGTVVLLVCIGVGTLVYVRLMRLLAPQYAVEARELLMSGFVRRPPPPSPS